MSNPVDRDAWRIGTQEREEALQCLGQHHAAGRLSMDEYEQRMAGVLEAQTRGEVRHQFENLPPPHPSCLAPSVDPITIPVPPPIEHPFGSDKNRYIAGLLQLVLPVGAGRFYVGDTGLAIAQLVTAFFAVGVIWCFLDGIKLLVIGGYDKDGRRLGPHY